jgi:hypothetical protein
MTNRFGGLPEYDPRRDDSPSSIDAIKRAIALSPIRRRNRQPRQGSQDPVVNRFLFKQDHRARLPSWIARFIGYRKEEKGTRLDCIFRRHPPHPVDFCDTHSFPRYISFSSGGRFVWSNGCFNLWSSGITIITTSECVWRANLQCNRRRRYY